MYSVEHNNVFIAFLATSFGHYGHHQANAIQNLKRLLVPVQDVMEILHITKKEIMMNTLEKFRIYNEKRLYNQINDKFTVKYNPIFNTIIHKNSYRE